MIIKKNPRKDVVSQESFSADKLLRFCKYKNEIKFDKEQNLPGRGAYVLNNPESIEILFKKKLLNRAFKCNIDPNTYNKLREEVLNDGESKE